MCWTDQQYIESIRESRTVKNWMVTERVTVGVTAMPNMVSERSRWSAKGNSQINCQHIFRYYFHYCVKRFIKKKKFFLIPLRVKNEPVSSMRILWK